MDSVLEGDAPAVNEGVGDSEAVEVALKVGDGVSITGYIGDGMREGVAVPLSVPGGPTASAQGSVSPPTTTTTSISTVFTSASVSVTPFSPTLIMGEMEGEGQKEEDWVREGVKDRL